MTTWPTWDGLTVAPGDVPVDEVLVVALRALLRATDRREVAAAVAGAVRRLGGDLEPPTASGRDQLPVDLSFGGPEPVVAAGDPLVLASLREVLPGLVADATIALERTRRAANLLEGASVDPLTGVSNRRVGMRVVGRLRSGDSVVMVDLDHFKRLNDTHGHAAGDAVLRSFGRTLLQGTRATDTVARLGGEEFALLLPHTTPGEAKSLLTRLRTSWQELRPHPVSFSAGVAWVGPAGGPEALRQADQALYTAKAQGRDRITLADG